MIASVLLSLGAMASGDAPATIDRPAREDTIYVLRGDPMELEAFSTSVEGWQGGELVRRDADGRAFYFWAYSERTASQARQFLMPAAFSGLEIEVQPYDQEKAFPDLRQSADDVARECRIRLDPFFVTPTGRVQLRPMPEHSYDEVVCLLGGAKASDIISKRLDFIGNEKVRNTEGQ